MACPQLGLMQMAFLIMFSQYLKGVAIPLPCKMGYWKIACTLGAAVDKHV
jgi:hypothetical protein